MTPTRWIVAAFVAVLVLALGVQTCRLRHADEAALKARADATRAELEKQGWIAAHPDRAPESVVSQPLQEEAKAARKVGATVAAAVHVQSGEVAVDVPRAPVCPSGDAPGGGGATPPVPPLLVSAGHEGVVSLDDVGRAYWKGRLWVTLRDGAWSRTVEPPVVDAQIAVDPELAAAWKAHKLPPRWPTWEARIGVGLPGPLAVVGATWYPSRHFGVWGDLAAPVGSGGGFSTAAGVALRF